MDVRIKGYAGWMGSVFLFLQKFLVLAAGPSRGAVGLRCWVWWSDWWGGRERGLSDASIQGMESMVCSRDGCVWLAPLRGVPSGRSVMSGAWP